ncbi:MAG: hypothetical protein QOJ64_3507 [Acidobacteriota bacterium]|jgi:predicted RNase H-like nuclease/cytidine deaminase|nr:hypothetical protein [Acidobacteriota bacterium]
MTTTFIGIDLAWKSQRNPTGVAVLKGDRRGALLELTDSLAAKDSVAEFVSTRATASTVIAIDAPLIIGNQTGQRECETAISKRYGARDASCHTTNLSLYRDASSVALTAQLVTQGFRHVDPNASEQQDRIMMEVYPHAAMVELWNLKKIIKYKKGSPEVKREGLKRLRRHMIGLCNDQPPLLCTGELMGLLGKSLNDLVGRSLKKYEDQLDALICAYLAYYFWYWDWEKNEMYGDIKSGYIVNPRLPSLNPERYAGLEPQTLEVEPSYSDLGSRHPEPGSLSDLIARAHQLAHPFKTSDDCTAVSVASVIVSRSGKIFSGVSLDLSRSLGFCAEHAAIAEMLKAQESEIEMVVAVDEHGAVLPPCGRCREMMWQLNKANRDALVVLSADRARPLHELLPER